MHAPIRLLDQLGNPALSVAGVSVTAFLQGAGSERRGHFARLCAAHPVGDREQRRVADE
jgi:hypothetical protein